MQMELPFKYRIRLFSHSLLTKHFIKVIIDLTLCIGAVIVEPCRNRRPFPNLQRTITIFVWFCYITCYIKNLIIIQVSPVLGNFVLPIQPHLHIFGL